MVAALAEQRSHICAAVDRQIWILVGVGFRSTVVIATVVPVAACRDAHHACKVWVENLSESLTAVRRFLYFFAILAPSSEESDGCVFVGRSVRVDSIEEVGAPGIRHVGTFLKSYNVDLVVAAKFQIFCRHIGIFRQISLDILCHAKHLLRLGIAPQATVFSCGVSRVEKQFEIAPAC